MITAVHAALAIAANVALWRGLERASFVDHGPGPEIATAFTAGVLVASAVGSATAIVAGRGAWSAPRALAWDAAAFAGAAWAITVMSLGPWTRDLAGIVLVAAIVMRLAPATTAFVGTLRPAALAFAIALGAYAALGLWLPVASLPFGDQVHYLLVADRLAHGSVATPLDERLFTELIGFPPAPEDAATHVAATGVGPRPVQGYALALAILPGWVGWGRAGVQLVLALIGAWTSFVTFLILRDLWTRGALPPSRSPRRGDPMTPDPAVGDPVVGDRGMGERVIGHRVVGATWLMATALLPVPLLATHVYPNILGAALIATAYRWGFTAPQRRPALAAAILALTLFLTPRDAIALVVLLPFLMLAGGRPGSRPLIAAAAVFVLVCVANAVLYGIPLPYASYLVGTGQAQDLTKQGSITAFIWVTLPAILFDRTLGIAGTAPWAYIGLVGLVPALRWERARRAGGDVPPTPHLEGDHAAPPPSPPLLLPAALAVGASVLALAFFRLWEGGYAPPARYFVDVLPLWMPFVACGLAIAVDRIAAVAPRAMDEKITASRRVLSTALLAAVAVIIGVSAVTSLILNAVPSLALNSAFDDKIRDAVGKALGIDPLGWLPSFQPLTPNWWVSAYLRLIPALLVAAALGVVALGRSGRFAPERWQSGTDEVRFRTGTVRDQHRIGAVRPQTLSEGPRPRGRRLGEIAVFLLLNVVGTALVVIATRQPWVALGPDPVPDSLYRKWLPLSLGFVTVATAIVGWAVSTEARAGLFRRHYAVYVVPLALLLVARFGEGGVVNGALGAVYLVIGVAFAVNALLALWRDADRISDRGMALQLAVVALAAGLVLLPYHRAVMPTASDEPHYLLVTQSLLYDRDLDVANDYAGDRYSAFYPSRLPDMHGIQVGSAVYSIRDLGMPILAVIPYAIAGRVGVEALLCLVGAALAAQLYLLSRDLGFGARASFLAAATAALTHPLLTYTTQIYPELLTALAFVSAARLMRAGTRTTLRDLALASLLIGTLPWLSTRAWPIVVGAGVVLAVIALRPAWPRPRDLALRAAAGALPFTALVLVLCYVNWRTFGVFLPSAGYFLIREQQPVLTFTFWIGAPGLLFDRVFGLIPRAPLYLVAFLGAVPLLRRGRGHTAELAAVILGSVLSYVYIADIAYWWADGSPPSRYLLASLPLFVVAAAAGWEVLLGDALPRAWRSPARVLAAVAVIASAVVVYIYAALPNLRYDLALDIAATRSPGELFTFLGRATGVDAGVLFPSLVRPDPANVALTVGWIGIAVVLAAIGARKAASPR